MTWDRMFYDDWVSREGLELLGGHAVDDVFTLPLRPWPRQGGLAAHIRLEGSGGMAAAYVCELPPGAALKPQRHLYDEVIYVLSGRGSTSVWVDGRAQTTVEWAAGSLLSIPLNAWHEHRNADPARPARYLAVTTAPAMLNMLRDERFVFDNPQVFPDRYDGHADHFRKQEEVVREVPYLATNFVPDVRGLTLLPTPRGEGTSGRQIIFPESVFSAHLLRVPAGTYTKAHHHGPGAHILWLEGEGYTLMWPEWENKVKADFRPGTLTAPPGRWWHLHAAAGARDAVHLAIKVGSRLHPVSESYRACMRDSRDGGTLTDHGALPKHIQEELRALFLEECRRKGTRARAMS